jgi:hypothetical protein
MNNLINLGKLVEELNANSDCVAEAHIQSTGILIEFRRHRRHLHQAISWEDIKSANIDVLTETFNQMVEKLGCQDAI